MKTQTETQTESEAIFYHVHWGGGVCLSACWDATPPGAGTPPEADTPPVAGTPPQQTATVADGTHPTGMHSRCLCFSFKFCGR